MRILVALLTIVSALKASAATQTFASFSILGDLVRQVAPVPLEVEDLVEAGQDPHQHQVTGKDLEKLKTAKLVFQVGRHFEGWLPKALTSVKSSARVITVTDDLKLRAGDPHFWHDPARVQQVVQKIAEALREELPRQAAEISQREKKFTEEIEALSQDLKKRFQSFPAEQRVVITSHDAFGYFGEAFGLQFLAPQGWSAETEPSAKAMAQLVRQIRTKKVKALFVEELANSTVIRQISKETGVREGGTLYADSLSKAAEPAGTYLRLLRHNGETILRSLGGP